MFFFMFVSIGLRIWLQNFQFSVIFVALNGAHTSSLFVEFFRIGVAGWPTGAVGFLICGILKLWCCSVFVGTYSCWPEPAFRFSTVDHSLVRRLSARLNPETFSLVW
uniref:Transmembrane protein n=1 Tax=Toxoplasma gondii (strain ATCC 50861 / VEG) TaxID=432359 RepID=A0A0F7V9R2_TOXGV|nr:TPA: hypothetical protein BN1205_062050 [Toxoplasma gondii VEG]